MPSSSPESEKGPTATGGGPPSSPGTPTELSSVLEFGQFAGSEADSLPLPTRDACSPAAALGGQAPEESGPASERCSLAPATPSGRPLPAALSLHNSSSSSAVSAAGDTLPQVEEAAEEVEAAFQDVLRLARMSLGGKEDAGSGALSFQGPPSSACRSPPVRVTAHLPEPQGGRASPCGSSDAESSSCSLAPPPAEDEAITSQQHYGSVFPDGHLLLPPVVCGPGGGATAGPWGPAALTQQYPQYQDQQYQYKEQEQYTLGWAPVACGWTVTYFQQGPPLPAFPPPAFITTPLNAAPPPYAASPSYAAPPPSSPPGFGPRPEQHRSRAGARVYSGSRVGRRLPGEPAPSKLLARFRQKLPPPSGGDWTLQSVRGELLDFACDAEVSRTWLQAVALRHAAPAELAEAFRAELQPWLLVLATHASGNYVVQWFLTPDNVGPELLPEVAAAVGAAVAGRAVELSRHSFGCRVLQALLKVLGPEARVAVALKLSGHAAKLATDLHANHVLRVCLETVTPSDPIRTLIEELVAEPLQLCMDCYGCRLLPAVLAYCTISELKEVVSEAVVAAVPSLIRHRYGNYVVKALYANGSPADRAAIVAGVAPQAAQLSLNKFASFFVDTLLEAGAPQEREAVARGLLLAPKELLVRAMRDESGNYVMRHALERSSGEVREALLAVVLPEVPELWESHYGRHVAQSVARLLGDSSAGWQGRPQ